MGLSKKEYNFIKTKIKNHLAKIGLYRLQAIRPQDKKEADFLWDLFFGSGAMEFKERDYENSLAIVKEILKEIENI